MHERYPPAVLIMKVGYHVAEDLAQIIRRKRKEQNDAGLIFWGYGGTLCHPIKVVVPFAKQAEASRLSVMVLMPVTRSKFVSRGDVAAEYSLDGVHWRDVPRGIKVTGSRYALVLRNLKEFGSDIDLSKYRVPLGPKSGVSLDGYLRSRVDKAVGLLSPRRGNSEERVVHVMYAADLVKPYAVLLR